MDRKVALITGGAQGIGAAISRKFASKNYNVVINYLNSEDKAKALKIELEKEYGVEVLIIKADITQEDMVKEMVNQVIERFARIDCLVNNAAICLDNYYNDKSIKEFKKVLEVNLIGSFLTCKYIGNVMMNQKNGRIINISSTNGIDTNEDYSMDYDASKAGIISLTRNFAKALAPYVLVNAVAPGWTKTDIVLEMNPDYLEKEKQKILLKRFAQTEEIANVVAFLASNEASYVNSSVIRVDGGF